jgi:hypothetical protein
MARGSLGTAITKLFTALSRERSEPLTQPAPTAAPATGPTGAPVHLASCEASETIVVKTASSVYELIVLRGDCGEVLVRGGQRFTTFCRALFVGSLRSSGAIERQTIDVGLRMKFHFDNLVIVTSAVESVTRHCTGDDTTYCAAGL